MITLKPCPFCGTTPDADDLSTFGMPNSSKWGAVQCCVGGPEVRTNYMPVEHWKQRAAEAWNTREDLVDHTQVTLPTNADEAAMMVLLGTQFLKQNAPERLKK